MRIGSIQRTTLIDYPGKIACTIFTQGCNFRCDYCHNPELVIADKFKKTIPIKTVTDFLESRIGKLQGVCITGGEPTLHKDLPNFIRNIKNKGFLVKLDTNGSNPDMLENLLNKKLLDMIAMDIKGPLNKYGEISHPKISIENIKHSIEIIKRSNIEYEFRTTVVKDQLKIKDFEDIGKVIKGARKYYLQRFIPTKTLESNFMKKKTYSDEEFLGIKNLLDKYVNYCDIR